MIDARERLVLVGDEDDVPGRAVDGRVGRVDILSRELHVSDALRALRDGCCESVGLLGPFVVQGFLVQDLLHVLVSDVLAVAVGDEGVALLADLDALDGVVDAGEFDGAAEVADDAPSRRFHRNDERRDGVALVLTDEGLGDKLLFFLDHIEERLFRLILDLVRVRIASVAVRRKEKDVLKSPVFRLLEQGGTLLRPVAGLDGGERGDVLQDEPLVFDGGGDGLGTLARARRERVLRVREHGAAVF